MVFKRFSIAVSLRIALLCISVFALFYLLAESNLIVTTFIFVLLIIYQVFLLVNFVQKTNRELARFFNSIKYSDFAQSFNTAIKGSSFEELDNAFYNVIEEFRKNRTEKEEHYRYFQTIVQHVGIGVLVFKNNGEIEMMNTEAKRLLKVTNIKNISALAEISKPLVESLRKIRAGEKVLIKIPFNTELLLLTIYAAEFKLRGIQYKLISLSNIQRELEEREMEAWENLIRVLTHEIMNSVTPIISLSSTANSLLGKGDSIINKSDLEDVKQALNTIQKRSTGLLHFVNDYRDLTRILIPNFQLVKISNLFERIRNLLSSQFNENKIDFSTLLEPNSLEIRIDPDLIEQVLINLIQNSINALLNTTYPKIQLIGKIDSHSRPIILIVDNGHGIPVELYEKIFIPFFTTRKEGSGIGLNLARQIMRVHNGNISVKSTPFEETVFTLHF